MESVTMSRMLLLVLVAMVITMNDVKLAQASDIGQDRECCSSYKEILQTVHCAFDCCPGMQEIDIPGFVKCEQIKLVIDQERKCCTSLKEGFNIIHCAYDCCPGMQESVRGGFVKCEQIKEREVYRKREQPNLDYFQLIRRRKRSLN